MKKFSLLVLCVLFLLSISLPTSAGAAENTKSSQGWEQNKAKITTYLFNYLKENAGLATYIYTDRTIDMEKAKELFDSYNGIKISNKDYIIGKDYKNNHNLLITKDGLIVNFISKDEGMSGYYDSELPLDTLVKETVKRLTGPTLDTFNHIHFQYPDAERLLIADLRAKTYSIADNVEINELSGVFRSTYRSQDREILNNGALEQGSDHTIASETVDGYSKLTIDGVSMTKGRFYSDDYISIVYTGSPITYTGDSYTNIQTSLVNRFEQTFTDVDRSNDHYDGIKSLVEQDIIRGYENGSFKPWNNIQRRHVAVMLFNAKELSAPANLNTILRVYNDVDSNTYYAEEIAAVTKENIFKGVNGKFNPNLNITREQMATVLVLGLGLDKYNTDKNVNINLDNVGPSHKERVQILANLGITNQLDDFSPGKPITRAAFSTFLHKAQQIIQ